MKKIRPDVAIEHFWCFFWFIGMTEVQDPKGWNSRNATPHRRVCKATQHRQYRQQIPTFIFNF
jgi:hypothetical protein